MTRLAFFIVLFFTSLFTLSQKQANYWHFGLNAGLDYSGGEPVPINDSKLETYEGCSSISDIDGNFLFYTDGSYIWNRNNQFMPNGTGLYGHTSSTQSAIIVPVSDNGPLYYAFTIDAVDGWPDVSGLCYSIVNMELENGLGDVIESSKNTLLMPDHCEKVTAVGNYEGDGTWIVLHKWQTNEFYAYLLTSSGIDPPVITTAGPVITGIGGTSKGYIKISPDGQTLAVAHAGLNMIQIMDFNIQTGVVSNAFQDKGFGTQRPYGISFSPDSRFLYVSTWKSENGSGLYQYDLLAGSNQEILQSKYMVGLNVDGALQLAPNNRIYAANSGTPFLGVILYPNEKGPACTYVSEIQSLAGKTCEWGLPPFVQSFFNPEVSFINDPPCYTVATQFYENCAFDPDSVLWDFGDPASGDENTSREFEPTHLFTSDGLFTITLTAYSGTDNVQESKVIRVNLIPDVNLGNDTALCNGNSIIIQANEGYDNYLWHNGFSTQTFETDTAGTFWVKVTNAGCVNHDSIVLEISPNYFYDTLMNICFGETIEIGGQTIGVPGTYFDSLNTINGCDSIYQIELLVNDTALLERDISICTGDSVFAGGAWQSESGTYYDYLDTYQGCDSTVITNLTVDDIIQTYAQADICEGDSIFLAEDYQTTAGTYYDTAVSVSGCDSIHTTMLEVFELYSKTIDTNICEGESVYAGGEYQTDEGTYYDNLQSLHGCDSLITTNIYVEPLPTVDLGKDTLLPIDAELLLEATYPGADYLWQDGSTDSVFLVTEEGTYSVTVSTGCGSVEDAIEITYQQPEIPPCTPQSPNAFSPNGDGLNDEFKLISECEYTTFNLRIFDRWGKLIFEATDLDAGWDGTSNGKEAPIGAYIWRVEYSESREPDLMNALHGTVMLVK